MSKYKIVKYKGNVYYKNDEGKLYENIDNKKGKLVGELKDKKIKFY